MGLESATIISELNPNNPEPSDKRRFGDDHLRMIKQVLQTNFPNLTAIANMTAEELNYLVGVTSLIQDQLDAKLEDADVDLTNYAQFTENQTWQKTQQITPIDHGNRSGSLIIDGSQSNSHIVTATDNLAITFSVLAEGQDITLKLVQGKSSPAAVITLPGEMRFSFGSTPQLTQTLGKYDVIGGKVLDGVLVCGLLREVG
jgi:hypothetical protein